MAAAAVLGELVLVVLRETVGVVTVALVARMLQVLQGALLLIRVVVRLWVLLGVLPEVLRGVVPGVLREARLRRVMEVGRLELVVIVTPRALRFSGCPHMVVRLPVVGLVGV